MNQLTDDVKDELLKLDNQLCFALYAYSREVIKKYKPLLDPLGLTYTQYITLLVLWETPSLSFKHLAERLRLDSGTLTPLLKKMEAAGLLTRQRDHEDERSVIITLTKQGEALKAAARQVPEALMNSSCMSVEDGIMLKSLLQKALCQLEDESV